MAILFNLIKSIWLLKIDDIKIGAYNAHVKPIGINGGYKTTTTNIFALQWLNLEPRNHTQMQHGAVF
jgi:hypothetical protein